MNPMKYRIALCLALTCLVHDAAQAHSFNVSYVLPIPLWIYMYACMAMLVVSFAVIAYFFTTPAAATVAAPSAVATGPGQVAGTVGRSTIAVLRGGAAALLVVTIIAGLIGTKDPLTNVNMTLFWVVFLLGFAYLTAMFGDLFAAISPWEALLDVCERCGVSFSQARVRYPQALGYLPALGGYVGLIWIELFTEPRPFTLSVALMIYTGIVLAGAWLFGRAAWTRHGEFFSLFFRLIGSMAPVAYTRFPGRDVWQWRLRPLFSGIVDGHEAHWTLVLFVLFMLSSSTYDGLHDTQVWLDIFWKHLLQLIEPFWGTVTLKQRSTLIIESHAVYQRGGLFLVLAVYVAVYWSAVAAARKLAGSIVPVRDLAVRFAFSLVPIAFVYNVTHYFTFLIAQVRELPWLISDPLGAGWDLLHLGRVPQWPPLDMAVIWHTQVALILIGHVASVGVAHLISLRVFKAQRQAVLTQIPMLVLMMVYTGMGLWILSLHLSQQIAEAGG